MKNRSYEKCNEINQKNFSPVITLWHHW